MAFYQIPRLNEAVRWLPGQPSAVVRFTAGGGLALLYATADPDLTPKDWHTQPLQLGLFGTTRTPDTVQVPPMLCVQIGEHAVQVAPVCIFEIGAELAIYEWLNARAMPPELRLVLLRLDTERPGQATVEGSRRIWTPEWVAGDALLRLRLEQQCLDTAPEEAGWVQHNGREQAGNVPARLLLERSGFRLDVPGEGMDFSTSPVAERITAN